jgi:hypothetical protein
MTERSGSTDRSGPPSDDLRGSGSDGVAGRDAWDASTGANTSTAGSPAGATFRGTPKGPNRLRIGLVAGSLLAIVTAATVTIGATPTPGARSQASTDPGSGRAGGGRVPALNLPFTGLRDRALSRLDRLGGAWRFREVTITAIDGSNVSLKTEDGWTRTITVTSSTTITKAGQPITLADLRVGDAIRFRQTRNADGSYAINAINVVVPRVAGTVTAVTANGFTLTKRDGTTWTVTVDGSTTYTVGTLERKAGSRGDVNVGSEVVVQGTQSSGNSVNAMAVRVALPMVAGQVTSKSGNTITVRRLDGTTATIRVSAATTYRVRGTPQGAGLANITVGMGIVAEGTQRSDGSLDASAVRAGALRGALRDRLPKAQRPGASPSPSPSTP